MNIVSQVCDAIMRTLTTVAESAGRESGLVQRARKLTGDKFAQTLVFGWLKNPQATLEELSQTASALGVQVSPQAIDQRFGQPAAVCLKKCFRPPSKRWLWRHPRPCPYSSLLARC